MTIGKTPEKENPLMHFYRQYNAIFLLESVSD